MIEVRWRHQALRRHGGGRRPVLRRRPGQVTGFLGPNGSGKVDDHAHDHGPRPARRRDQSPSTGVAYRELPLAAARGGGAARGQGDPPRPQRLQPPLALAQTNDIPRTGWTRCSSWSGSPSVAQKRAGKFSLGMGQRLGIAAALLGDPGVLLFDEPINGLDPEGIRWVRNLLKGLAAEGRTVFVSSHLMSEMALTADHLVVIGRGRLIADGPVADFIAESSGQFVRVAHRGARASSPRPLTASGAQVVHRGRRRLARQRARRGRRSASSPRPPASPCTSSRRRSASLEEAFMELTQDSVEFHGADDPAPTASPVTRTASPAGK